MNTFNISVGIFSLALALLGIALTLRANRRKLVTFDIRGPISLISVLSDVAGRRLTILYEKTTGDEPVRIKNAYLHYIRIANLGRESVRKQDLAPGDPLRIEVQGGSVLELAIASVTRPVLGFSLDPLHESRGVSASNITFDFLDYKDGALIRLLTDSSDTDVKVLGSVVGMPSGLRSGTRSRNKGLGFVSLFLMLAIWCSANFAFLRYVFGPPDVHSVSELPALTALSLTIFMVATGFAFLLLWTKYFAPAPDEGWPKSIKLPVNFSPLGLLFSHHVDPASDPKDPRVAS